MREVTMPSGAVLKVNPAPFADAKNLYQAVLEELKEVKIKTGDETAQLLKDIACFAFSSKKVEQALTKCMEKCQYGDRNLKIDGDSFSAPEARKDYVPACVEVAKENLEPFMSGLFAGLSILSSLIPDAQA